MKTNFVNFTVVSDDSLPNASHFSSWMKLLRSTAWMLRFVTACRTRERYEFDDLLLHEIQAAERIWWTKSQRDSFPEEIACLQHGRPIPKSSRLFQLNPVMDDSGLLRVKGRLGSAAMITDETKNPLILDPKHQFVRVLIQHYHERAGHHGQEFVANELRQRYWILHLVRLFEALGIIVRCARTIVQVLGHQRWDYCQIQE